MPHTLTQMTKIVELDLSCNGLTDFFGLQEINDEAFSNKNRAEEEEEECFQAKFSNNDPQFEPHSYMITEDNDTPRPFKVNDNSSEGSESTNKVLDSIQQQIL